MQRRAKRDDVSMGVRNGRGVTGVSMGFKRGLAVNEKAKGSPWCEGKRAGRRGKNILREK